MNKLEELHFPHSKNWDCYNDAPYKKNHALKSAKITEQIAIEFADWIADNWSPNGRLGCWDSKELNSSRESKYLIDTTKELFEEFLKQRQ
jgi:hypothetical protein